MQQQELPRHIEAVNPPWPWLVTRFQRNPRSAYIIQSTDPVCPLSVCPLFRAGKSCKIAITNGTGPQSDEH